VYALVLDKDDLDNRRKIIHDRPETEVGLFCHVYAMP
jgi:hypothetical protein